MLVIKYGYMFRLFLSHPQANMVTEFRYIKCASNGIPLCLLLIEIYVGTAFHNLSSDIPILIDGVCLTSKKFNRILPVVLYQYNTIIGRL